MKLSAKTIYYPFLIIYAVGPLLHDVIPHLSIIGLERGGYFSLFYFVALIATLPIVFFIKRVESKTINLSPSIISRMALGLGVFVVPYVLFWSDWALFHISLLIALYVSFLSLVSFRKGLSGRSSLLKDSATGSYYMTVNGKPYRLTEKRVEEIRASNAAQIEYAQEFNPDSLDTFKQFSNESSFIKYPDSYSSNDANGGIDINPASGSPMVGGISGLDIHGNSWGTNFNEPSNTYDPNRGY